MRRARITGPRGMELDAGVPETRVERARGLLGRAGLAPGEALLIERARSVHTFGMRFPITVAFLDGGLRVIETIRMRPGRLALPRPGVRHVLECPAGTDLRPGDRLVRQGRR